MPAQLLNFPQQPQSQGKAGAVADPDDDGRLSRSDTAARQYLDYVSAKDAEITEAREPATITMRIQWTAAEIATLNERKQPVVTSNRFVRKIDAVVGLIEKLEARAQGLSSHRPQPRRAQTSPRPVMRYVLDRWTGNPNHPHASSEVSTGWLALSMTWNRATWGTELGVHIVDRNVLLRSALIDEVLPIAVIWAFAKWVDVDLAKELVPGKAEEIGSLVRTEWVGYDDLDRY